MELAADTTTDLPKWWTQMDEDRQELYLRLHPQSKMHKVANDKLRERLKAKPKERVKLRKLVKQIAASPIKALRKDFAKIDKAADSISDDKSNEIKKHVHAAGKKGGSKKILKAVVGALAVAGVLTLGAGLLASGGLPYAIIGARLFSDTKQVTRDIYTRIREGEDATKAVFNTVKDTIAKTARDPKMIAAALMITTQKGDKKGKQDTKGSKPTPTTTKEKKEPKRQKFPEKKSKPKEKANA